MSWPTITPIRKEGPGVKFPEGVEPEKLEIVRELYKRGYNVLQYLGEGKTREAFLAQHLIGGFNKLRVVKIPKSFLDDSSIQTYINRSKRDVDENELDISNKIKHPNVVEIVDSFIVNGKRVNIEPHYEANDLETIVQQTGPLSEDRFENIAKQFLDGASYLENEGYLHRDIKPSNILLTNNGVVMISDLQTAVSTKTINYSSLPTRGGIVTSHPNLINSLLTNERSFSDARTEAYSVGATLFYLLTGEYPFDYNISNDEDGKSVIVEDKEFKIKLNDGNNDLEKITNEDHEEKLRVAIKKVPKKYRNLIYKCLTTRHSHYYDIGDVKEDFEKIIERKGLVNRFKETVKDIGNGIKKGLIIGGLLGAIGATFASYDYFSGNEKRSLSDKDIFMREDYRNFGLENLTDEETTVIRKELKPYLIEAKTEIDKMNNGKGLDIGTEIQITENIHFLPKRLVSAYLQSCYINKERISEFKDERANLSFVPKKFVRLNIGEYSPKPKFDDELTMIAEGVMYLKQNIGLEKNVADVYSSYFSNKNDIREAMIKGGIEYFSYKDKEGNSFEGFGKYLPEHQKDLINTAIGIYMITDNDGITNWERVSAWEERR